MLVLLKSIFKPVDKAPPVPPPLPIAGATSNSVDAIFIFTTLTTGVSLFISKVENEVLLLSVTTSPTLTLGKATVVVILVVVFPAP